jgi:hypothetical protein
LARFLLSGIRAIFRRRSRKIEKSPQSIKKGLIFRGLRALSWAPRNNMPAWLPGLQQLPPFEILILVILAVGERTL